MTTTENATQCHECHNQRATYYDTVGERPLCSDCAKEAALDRLHGDGEITSLEAHIRDNAST